MSCSRYRQMLSLYVDGEATPRQRQELLKHVESCPECAAWLARVRQTDVLLKGADNTGPSDRVRDAVLGSLRRNGPSQASSPAPPSRRPHRTPPRALQGLSLGTASILLRYNLTAKRIAGGVLATLVAITGLAFWLNIIPPVWSYNKLGFEYPGDAGSSAINTTPVPAISSGVNGVGGPVAVPNLVQVLPPADMQGVHTSEAVRVRFDLPMDRASVEQALQVDPPAAGAFNWDADNELRFSPDGGGLLRGISYTVTLSNSARSLAGTPLQTPVSWTFETRRPYEVSPLEPAGATLAPTATLLLNFEAAMDAVSAEANVSLRMLGAPSDVPFTATWGEDGRRLTLVPTHPLSTGQVVLRVGADARTRSGETIGRTAEYQYAVELPNTRLRILDKRTLISSAGAPQPLRYEALENGAPISSVALDIYRFPADRLSALGAQSGSWPAALPDGITTGLEQVYTGAGGEDKVELPVLPSGIYLALVSAQSGGQPLLDWTLIVAADRKLTPVSGYTALWATGDSGEPWAGAEVSVYSPVGALLEKGPTGPTGAWSPSSAANGGELAIAQDSSGHLAAAIIPPPTDWSATDRQAGTATFLTDLPSYSPGQAINFRVLHGASVVGDEQTSVILFAPGGSVVATMNLKPDSLGGVTGLVSLSPNAEEGIYTIRVRTSNTIRDFTVDVRRRVTDTLSVLVVPGSEEVVGQGITGTVSVLGPLGEPISAAVVTATLRITGDSWISERVATATDRNGQAVVALALPSWLSEYNEPAIYLHVEAGFGVWFGRDEMYLDLTSRTAAERGSRQMVSPSLGVAAIAQQVPDGTTAVRVVALSGAPAGSIMVAATSQGGAHEYWTLDRVSQSDATLILPAEFAGGYIDFHSPGIEVSRRLPIMPSQGDALTLQVSAPATVEPGAELPVSLALTDIEGQGTGGLAAVQFRRVSGVDSGAAARGWEPNAQIDASGKATAVVTAPAEPGLWYVQVSASAAGGLFTRSWAVIEVVPGITVQLPPAQQADSGGVQRLSMLVHNTGDHPVSSGIRVTGSGVQVLDGGSQGVDVNEHRWQVLSWRYTPTVVGESVLTFSFMPSAGVAGSWSLPVQVRDAGRNTDMTTYTSGMVTELRSVGVQVPFDLSGGQVQLQIRATSSLLAALSGTVTELTTLNDGSVARAAARLSAGPAVLSAYDDVGSRPPDWQGAAVSDALLALQDIYAAQHEDGGWGAQISGDGPSTVQDTAGVLVSARRQSLSGGPIEPQFGVDAYSLNRGLLYLQYAVTSPISSRDAATQLDERAYGLYALALHGRLPMDEARRLMAYSGSTGAVLSPEGRAWLALALWQGGSTDEALVLLDRLLESDPLTHPGAAAPLLELLIAAGNSEGRKSRGVDSAVYAVSAGAYARQLMESRQGQSWSGPTATSNALWALLRYAAATGDKPLPKAPALTLNDRAIRTTGRTDDPGMISVVLSGGDLHAGTNWLKMEPAATGRPLYYSLTLRASK